MICKPLFIWKENIFASVQSTLQLLQIFKPISLDNIGYFELPYQTHCTYNAQQEYNSYVSILTIVTCSTKIHSTFTHAWSKISVFFFFLLNMTPKKSSMHQHSFWKRKRKNKKKKNTKQSMLVCAPGYVPMYFFSLFCFSPQPGVFVYIFISVWVTQTLQSSTSKLF